MATITPNAIDTVLRGGEGVTHTEFNPVLQVILMTLGRKCIDISFIF